MIQFKVELPFKIDGGVADVNIVEAAPHNVGHNGEYIGVGGHLLCYCLSI